MILKKLIPVLAAIMLTGCSDDSLLKNQIIHVRTGAKKPSGACSSLGNVNGVGVSEKSGVLAKYEHSLRDIKRSVSSLGGNYLHIQKVVRDGEMISGEAYHCEPKKAPESE